MVKLVAVDIDHTLTRPEGEICDAAIVSLQAAQARGMHLALVSARPPQAVDSVADMIGGDIYRVSYLGAVIRGPRKNELLRRPMSIEAARRIAAFADCRGIGIALNIDDVEYQSRGYAGVAMTAMDSADRAMAVLQSGVPPVLMVVEGYDWAREIYEFCRQELAGQVHVTRHQMPDGTYTSTTVVDIQAEKGHAVAMIRDLLAIDRGEVLAIGDNESDGSMFRVAAIGVAVSGEDAPVNALATHVAPFLDGDGVVWAMARFAGV
jgi:hydroxymethylpyrimidine pyrophosphatase-like HAD family hydrolase